MFAFLRTRRFSGALLALTLTSAVVVLVVSNRAGAAAQPVPFGDSRLKIEYNSTDGDAGLQFFIDAPAWKEVEIFDPRGRSVASFEAGSRIRKYGLTELFSESSEPPFTEFPFSEFKKLFPEGRYAFRGVTIEGERLSGSFVLSHRVPDGPVIEFPAEDDVVPAGALRVRWQPVSTPAGVVIAGYQVLVVSADVPKRVFSADLPASVNSIDVPAEFLAPGEYHVEVLAVEVSGNQTLTDHGFTVR
jgi:hypothetical protein